MERMKTTKRDVAGAIRELNQRIPLAVQLQQEIERVSALLQAEKAAIRECLDAAGQPRHAVADGSEAVLVDEERLTWNVKKLEGFLTPAAFDELCPRKPESQKLRKFLDWMAPELLRQCAKGSHTSRLELRAPEAKPDQEAA